jgi:hypothetical protein
MSTSSQTFPDVGDGEWSAWYQSTFSSELAELDGGPPEPLRSGNGNNNNNLSNNGVGSSANKLIRRLRSIDAIDGLMELLLTQCNLEAKVTWERDSDAPTCRGCGTALGWTHLQRRHHCRICGLIYCSNCAPAGTNRDISRKCRTCLSRTMGLELIRRVRALERDAFSVPSREAVLAVARAYRVAIEAFDGESNREARAVLTQGLHTFLELDEIAKCLKTQ